MRLRADERGQAIQVGAVLLFALLIVAFAGYQAFVVPDQNRQVEGDHLADAVGDMHDLRNAVLGVGTRDAGESVRLRLGTSYPARALALNPPSPSGTVRTLGTDDPRINLTIANAAPVDENARQLWATDAAWRDGEPRFATGAVSYRPNYHEFGTLPEVVYEHSLLYAAFPDGTVNESGQRLIDGTDLSPTTVDGNFDRTSGSSTSVDLRAVSASRTTIDVRDDGDPIRLRFATRRSAEEWEALLRADEQTVGEGGHVVGVRPVGDVHGTAFDVVEVELAAGETYELDLTKVGIGTRVSDEPATYVTDVRGDGRTVPQGTTVPLVAEVRDAYNNPVGGVNVTADDPDGSFSATRTTGGDGRVRFDYPATVAGDRTVDVALAGSTGRPFETTTFDVEVYDPGSGGSGSDAAYNATWLSPAGEPGTADCDATSCTLDYSQAQELELAMETSPVADGATVEFSVEDTGVGTVDPSSGTTATDGTASTTFQPTGNGTTLVYASSGGSGDAIEIEVTNFGVAGPPVITDFDAQGGNHWLHARFDVQFEAIAGGAGITAAEVDLIDPDTGTVEDTWSNSYGGIDSVSEDLNNAVTDGFGAGDDYLLRLTITDADGRQAQETIERTG